MIIGGEIMSKNRTSVDVDEIKRYLKNHQYKRALKMVESVDLRKVRSAKELYTIVDVYMENKMYEQARRVLRFIRTKVKGRRVLHQLIDVSIKCGQLSDAQKYMQEFAKLVPGDPYLDIFAYQIGKSKGRPLGEQIVILERLKQKEYMEKWAFELAKLYFQTGNLGASINECKQLIVWFGEGMYVERAKALVNHYANQPIECIQQQEIAGIKINLEKLFIQITNVEEEEIPKEIEPEQGFLGKKQQNKNKGYLSAFEFIEQMEAREQKLQEDDLTADTAAGDDMSKEVTNEEGVDQADLGWEVMNEEGVGQTDRSEEVTTEEVLDEADLGEEVETTPITPERQRWMDREKVETEVKSLMEETARFMSMQVEEILEEGAATEEEEIPSVEAKVEKAERIPTEEIKTAELDAVYVAEAEEDETPSQEIVSDEAPSDEILCEETLDQDTQGQKILHEETSSEEICHQETQQETQQQEVQDTEISVDEVQNLELQKKSEQKEPSVAIETESIDKSQEKKNKGFFARLFSKKKPKEEVTIESSSLLESYEADKSKEKSVFDMLERTELDCAKDVTNGEKKSAEVATERLLENLATEMTKEDAEVLTEETEALEVDEKSTDEVEVDVFEESTSDSTTEIEEKIAKEITRETTKESKINITESMAGDMEQLKLTRQKELRKFQHLFSSYGIASEQKPETILGEFLHIPLVNNQIFKSLENILSAHNKNTTMILQGPQAEDLTYLAKCLIKVLYVCGLMETQKVAVIQYDKFLHLDFSNKLEKLKGCSILVEGIDHFEEQLFRQLDYLNRSGLMVIIEEVPSLSNRFLYEEYPQLESTRIELPEWTPEQLFKFVETYVKQKEYSLSEEACQKVKTIIKKQYSECKKSLLNAVMNKITSAYHCAKERNKVELRNITALADYEHIALMKIEEKDFQSEN